MQESISRRASIGRIPILDVRPAVDGGRRPAKSVTGEAFPVAATVFREGHGVIGAGVVLRDPRGRRGPVIPMRELWPGSDRWGAQVVATAEGRWSFEVQAWADPVATWADAARVKIAAGVDVDLMLQEGDILLRRAAEGVKDRKCRQALLRAAAGLRDDSVAPLARLDALTTPEAVAALTEYPLRDLLTVAEPMPVQVDRRRALYGSWYEFFPRSEGAVVDPARRLPPVSGTLRTAAERLPAIAEMGFDVVYLPPIHPIGESFRKGPDNSLTAGPYDVGSPWAIGSAAGGHDAIHPDLGTVEDFDAFVARATGLGMEVALDFALQCSPEHPWIKEHPEWFTQRADGSVAHAENPPKKYEDIHPLDFDQDFDGLVAATVGLLRHWMAHGVRIFRVDNPHTKPVAFWDRVLADIARTDPDVLFLAEAFTRPAMLHTLAMVGFHQSYTYFTWRNTKQELTEYLTELSGEAAAYLRPNFFANTPDILHAYLQQGGRAAFATRAVLAATLAPSWGVYAGYELCENVPVEPGSEEYASSEKYELRPRDWTAGDTLAPLLALLNRLRREHPSLQELRNLRFLDVDDDHLLAFVKRSGAGESQDEVIVVVNLDPRRAREGTVIYDDGEPGSPAKGVRTVYDELSGRTRRWGRRNRVRLDPRLAPAQVFTPRHHGVR